MTDRPIDIVIDENTDMRLLPDEVLFHLRAGGDEKAAAELRRRAREELDRLGDEDDE